MAWVFFDDDEWFAMVGGVRDGGIWDLGFVRGWDIWGVFGLVVGWG